jgi:hypothetical protein
MWDWTRTHPNILDWFADHLEAHPFLSVAVIIACQFLAGALLIFLIDGHLF